MTKLKTALDLVGEKVQGLVNDYREEIQKAWDHMDDTESLKVSFGATFGLKNGNNHCDVTIAFIPEHIKGSTSFVWNDNQDKLGLKKGGIDIDPSIKELDLILCRKEKDHRKVSTGLVCSRCNYYQKHRCELPI